MQRTHTRSLAATALAALALCCGAQLQAGSKTIALPPDGIHLTSPTQIIKLGAAQARALLGELRELADGGDNPACPYCLPGCDRLDGHDGRDPGACMGGGAVLLAVSPVPGEPGVYVSDSFPARAGVVAYDLVPPAVSPMVTVRPFRDLMAAQVPAPRFLAPPVPCDRARVRLGDDYYTGPEWADWSGDETRYPAEIFDVPREQYDRWEAASAAYRQMQEEIGELRSARLAEPGWVPEGWVKKPGYQPQP